MKNNDILNLIDKLKHFENVFNSDEVTNDIINDFEKTLNEINLGVSNNFKTPALSVNYKKLTEHAVEPKYANDGDAGLDLTVTSIISDTSNEITYSFGIALEIPYGYVGLLFPRSSVRKYDLVLTNCVGVIDSIYRGEIQATFKKTKGSESLVYNLGERAAQLLILPYPTIKLIEKETLSDTKRGENGYGSTGV